MMAMGGESTTINGTTTTFVGHYQGEWRSTSIISQVPNGQDVKRHTLYYLLRPPSSTSITTDSSGIGF
jgi:hypothetical protein